MCVSQDTLCKVISMSQHETKHDSKTMKWSQRHWDTHRLEWKEKQYVGEFIHTLLYILSCTLSFFQHHNLYWLDRVHACSYLLLSVLRRRIAGIGSRGCVRVHMCCGTGSTPRAQLFQCTGSSYGPDHQARFSLQVKTLQVAYHSISTHLKYLKSYFPLQLS